MMLYLDFISAIIYKKKNIQAKKIFILLAFSCYLRKYFVILFGLTTKF